MNRVAPRMRDFAERLIAHETRGNQSPHSKLPAAFQVCEKLRSHLTILMGSTGFQAVLMRALALASAEVPWLTAVRTGPDGAWEEVEQLEKHADPESIAQGSVILLARLLGLLTVFIGEPLTARLVREVWPRLSLDNLDGRKESENEKAN